MSIGVKVVCALPGRVHIVDVTLATGATVAQAIEKSGIQAAGPVISDMAGKVGIYGKAVSLGSTLRDGDRIEIYRSLQADPKAVRRERARKR